MQFLMAPSSSIDASSVRDDDDDRLEGPDYERRRPENLEYFPNGDGMVTEAGTGNNRQCDCEQVKHDHARQQCAPLDLAVPFVIDDFSRTALWPKPEKAGNRKYRC